MSRDITEQKQEEEALEANEERLRTIFESANDGMFVFDRQGRYVDVNPAGCRMFGYTREEFLSSHMWSVFFPEDTKMAKEKIKTFWEEGSFNPELRLRHKDGSEIWVDMTIASFRIGRKKFGLGVKRDITEKRKMKQELLRAQKLESIGLLAGGIAHDFNNFLVGIMGNAFLAKKRTKSGCAVYNKLERIENACLKATFLTQQLLTFAKGGAPIKKVISIVKLLKETTHFALHGSNVRCEISIPDDLWEVEVDEGQMNQVINNLIINADQAMPNGGVIHVWAENIVIGKEQALPLSEGKYIKIYIQDNGVGIPREHTQKLFDPYFTTKQKGNGLGLATSYSIIKKHEGLITLESEAGEGSTFFIYLPAFQDKARTNPVPEEIKRENMIKNPTMKKEKILIMDDEEFIRNFICEVLVDLGYEAQAAKNGKDAIKLYKEARDSGRPYNAVILDLTIPGGMGGKEALKKLIRIDPHIKAIVSSGYSNDPVMSDYKQFGFGGVISKPYEIPQLIEILDKVIAEPVV